MEMQEGSQLVIVAAFAQDDTGFLVSVARFDAHAPAITGFGRVGVCQIGGQVPRLFLTDIPEGEHCDGHLGFFAVKGVG